MEDHSKLSGFRAGLYRCFTRARDALFEVGDALVSHAPARSFVALSQAPCFQRRWPSCYEALEDGRIDRAALRRLFVAHLPQPSAGERLVLGVDVSPIPRPAARTAADRTLVHVTDLPKDAVPVRPGWCFSSVVVLPVQPSSWSYYLDSQRVASIQSATGVAVAQLGVLLPLLPARPVVLLDCGYGTLPWLQASADLKCDQLVRISPRRVFYRPVPPPTGKRGRPKLDGPRFRCADATARHPPAASWAGTDPAGRAVTIDAWTDLHLRKYRDHTLTVLHIVRVFLAGQQRVQQDAWFWWLGDPLPPLATLAGLYDRRFSQEHGYRFDKQDLLWASPRLRSPEQFERWTDLVTASHNALFLARPLAGQHLLPWESARRPVTPRQVRRVMGRIIAHIGTPARPPRPRGKSPGRPLGAVIRRAQRYPVRRKHPPKPKKPPRSAPQPA
jgi:DDE superfamily endonuclease